ncbi:amidase [Hirsutella rhossiliensis]|uniref:Amidase domain-containing protein n=1 Tax=Hirsutella rhossiliensis TaxID=111463 RepID=A0A9P8N471_9HYPO|nr:amidase domain-containing protein [Hirsutella rhossiliensis]KAH0966504.1 amidase domain-containing protein [Hirsutella rhossiliensis]
MGANMVSTVVRLGDIAYYMHPLPSGLDSPTLDKDQIAEPCTVLTIGRQLLGVKELQATIHDFKARDDVWSPDFLGTIVVQITESQGALGKDDENALRSLGASSLNSFHSSAGKAQLAQGPYFLHHGRLHQAYRLYPDTAGAFMVSTVPAGDNGFRSLDASAYGEQFPSALTVAVPSRLYLAKTKEKPYAGLRVAVKDIIDLKGLKTGASSRAYTELYPAKKANAATVQRLIDLGFVVVGKLKTTQFADSEWPTCDWVDYHGPFNPRGDGYLTPSGSSAGSASAVSSYAWLDFALGTDTLGSIRSPAAAQAIFGMRPTLGAASTMGLVPYSSNWDTIGGFARTAAEYKTLAQALYGSTDTAGKKPTKLIYPTDYWPVADEASQRVFEAFITRVEGFLGVKRTNISLADTWKKTRPKGTHESIGKHFHHAFDWSANRDQWTGLLQPFIKEYTKTMGKPPILNPQVRFKVGYTPTVTAEQKAQGEMLIKTYHDWFYQHIMPPAEDGYSSTIIVLPWTSGEPDYRDKYKDRPQQFTGQGFFFYNVGPYAQCPELIFPVGTTPYTSKFTGVVEQLPAAMGLIAAEGSDIMLADLFRRVTGCARLVDPVVPGPKLREHSEKGNISSHSRLRLEFSFFPP